MTRFRTLARARRCDGLDEDLLGGILGISAIPQHPLSDMKDPGLVTPDERIEGLNITLLSCGG
jgi:hypothetical protein